MGALLYVRKEGICMVIIMKPGTSQEIIHELVVRLEQQEQVQVGVTHGVGCSILGLVGDTAHLDMHKLEMIPGVERVMRVQEPYKKANRKFHPEDTIVSVDGVPVGGGSFTVIAGPCSVESEEQIVAVARDVKAHGAALLRGTGWLQGLQIRFRKGRGRRCQRAPRRRCRRRPGRST